VVIGILFWLPGFQRNFTRKNSLLVVSVVITVLGVATAFAFKDLKPWYPYVLGAIVGPIFINVPIIFNWTSELVDDKDSHGEAIGAMSAVRACSGIFGAVLPAIVGAAGNACDGSDVSDTGNPLCGGGPPEKLWNCVYFGLPWLLSALTALGAIQILQSRLGDVENMEKGRCSVDGKVTMRRVSRVPSKAQTGSADNTQSDMAKAEAADTCGHEDLSAAVELDCITVNPVYSHDEDAASVDQVVVAGHASPLPCHSVVEVLPSEEYITSNGKAGLVIGL